MPKKRAVMWGEFGGFVITLAASVYIQLNQQWLGEHPRIVNGLYGIALVFVVLFLSQTRWLRRILEDDSAPSEAPKIKQEVGRENSGRMVAATMIGSYHEATAIPPAPAPTPLPVIAFEVKTRFAAIVYHTSPGCWAECSPVTPNCKEAVLLDYTRDVPKSGEKTQGPVGGAGVIRFTLASGTENIPRAYWLQEKSNTVMFAAGHKETLIVAVREGSVFSAYSNPDPGQFMEDSFAVPFRQLGHRVQLEGLETFSVSLFDPYAHKTYDSSQFSINISLKSIQIVKLA